MGLFDKIKEPIFLKESSAMEEQLAALAALKATAAPKQAQKIEQDIQLLRAGNYGENSIVFELKNSHTPMLILRDLRLVHNGLTAQIDFLIITRKHIYIVECKNLYGNIEITNKGDFVRTKHIHGRYVKEGIYSPITQNQRHLELVKQLRATEKTNILTQFLFEKAFYFSYIPLVVLANTKTVLNAKYAKREVKEKVIRADQLVGYIQRLDAQPDMLPMSESEMEGLAHFFLKRHEANPLLYTEKYASVPVEGSAPPAEGPNEPLTTNSAPASASANAEPVEPLLLCPKCGAAMKKRRASKGNYAGKEFYGCSNYPHCRGIVNIG